MNQKYVVVDIETTGNDAKADDRIIQLAATVIENGEITGTFSSFLQAKKEIPHFIVQLTSITDEMVANAPKFADIAEEFLSLFDGAYFVAHNVIFDWIFLQEEIKRSGYPPMTCPKIDTVELARILLPTSDSYQLSDLAAAYQLEHDNPHQADSDAYVTAKLLLIFLEKLRKFPLVTLETLQKLARYLQSDISEIISNMIIEKMLKVNNDDKNFAIYRSIAMKKREFSLHFHHEDLPDFTDYLENHLITDFTKAFPSFQLRNGQLEMMKSIYQSFTEEKIAFIEAGTGIGKSLGYLLPSLFFSKQTEKPVVISTKTTQLQQQLMEKEIPMLKNVLQIPFEVAILKGRSHYLCLQKFEQILHELDTNYDNVLTKAKILTWLLETKTGDCDELNFPTNSELLVNRITVDTYSRKSSNPWLSRCFYEQAVNRLLIADIVVTNHTMLFQETELLSSYEYIVLDEGHHIEETASKAFGQKLYAKNLFYHLNKAVELLPIVRKKANMNKSHYKKLNDTLLELRFECEELFHLLFTYVANFQQNREGNKVTYRLDLEKENGKKWRVISELTMRIVEQVQVFCRLVDQVDVSVKSFQMREWLSARENLHQSIAVLQKLLLTFDENEVTWLEIGVKETFHTFYLYSQPISVADLLQERFFNGKKSVILTSGTLAVEQDFSYLKQAIGLKDREVVERQIPSIFQYEKQAQMYVTTNMPNVKEVSSKVYGEEIAKSVVQIAQVTEGKMLVLFTSQEMMKDAYESARVLPELRGFSIMAQGIQAGSRTRLMKQFKKLKKSILFGTQSFWEGIDLPGDVLQCLVIVRLPFSPPNAPITEAKIAEIEKMGGNAFQDYSMPQAILRFRQGFGRLIRTSTDKGIVVVLDKRMTTTFYGKKFLFSIPKIPLYEGDLAELLPEMERFFQET